MTVTRQTLLTHASIPVPGTQWVSQKTNMVDMLAKCDLPAHIARTIMDILLDPPTETVVQWLLKRYPMVYGFDHEKVKDADQKEVLLLQRYLRVLDAIRGPIEEELKDALKKTGSFAVTEKLDEKSSVTTAVDQPKE